MVFLSSPCHPTRKWSSTRFSLRGSHHLMLAVIHCLGVGYISLHSTIVFFFFILFLFFYGALLWLLVTFFRQSFPFQIWLLLGRDVVESLCYCLVASNVNRFGSIREEASHYLVQGERHSLYFVNPSPLHDGIVCRPTLITTNSTWSVLVAASTVSVTIPIGVTMLIQWAVSCSFGFAIRLAIAFWAFPRTERSRYSPCRPVSSAHHNRELWGLQPARHLFCFSNSTSAIVISLIPLG